MALLVVVPDDAVNLYYEQAVVSIVRFGGKSNVIALGNLLKPPERIALDGVRPAGVPEVAHDVRKANGFDATFAHPASSRYGGTLRRQRVSRQ